MLAPIFISYRRADSASEAGRLHSSITRELGKDVVFMDTSSIEPGTQWTQELEDALQSAQVVVVVIGPDWLRISDEWGMRRIDQENDWVRRELETVLNSGKKLLPVLVKGAKLPPADKLPQSLKNLTQRQAVDIRDAYWDHDIQLILQQLQMEVKQEQPPEKPDPLNEDKQNKIYQRGYSVFSAPDFTDFWGRTKEIEALLKKVQKSRITLIQGEPGVGKTYIAAQLAKNLSKEYRVLWIDAKVNFSLDKLVLHINEILKIDSQYGFITTYAEERLDIQEKIPILVDVISSSSVSKYVFFIDHFQRAIQPDLKPFIQRFNTHGGDSKLILISPPTVDLCLPPSTRIERFPILGFQGQEAIKYINRYGENHEIKWVEQDIQKVIDKTDGHPLAINLIVQCCVEGAPLYRVLENLLEYDRRYGDELRQKLLEEVAYYLNGEEQKAMHRLAVFRTLIRRTSWRYLNISEELGESLLRRRLLSPVDNDKFQMHPLIRQFWWESIKSEHEKAFSHEKAAHYYWNQARESLQAVISGVQDRLDFDSYAEAYYHFDKVNKQDLVAQVIQEFICATHKQERLLLRFPSLMAWLPVMNESYSVNKPWLILEKARKLEKDNTDVSRKKAETLFSHSYNLFNQLGDQLGASIALYYKGKILHLTNQAESALEVLEDVLKMAESAKDVPMQIRTLGKLVSCYTDLNRYDDAWLAADRGEKIAIGVGDRLGQALILYRKGSVERHRSNFEQAERYFSESAEAFEALGDRYRASKSLSRLGIVQDRLGKFESAVFNLKRAIEIKNSLSDKYGQALDTDYLGDVYRAQGLHGQSKDCYQQSLEIKQKREDTYGVVKSYNNLARLALLSEHLDEVAHLLEQSAIGIENLKQRNEKYRGLEGAFLTIQGDFQFVIGKYQEAIKSYKLAQECFVFSQYNYVKIATSLGRIYIELRSFDQAKAAIGEAIELSVKNSTPYHEALALTYLARLEVLCGHLEEAEKNYRLSIEIATKIGAKDILYSCEETKTLIEIIRYYFNELLFDSEETYNNYKQALLSTYRARVSVFTNQLEVAIKENDLAISLVTDKVTNTNDGLWVCTETKGLIEEGKTLQILQGETLQENNKVKEKLIGKVWKEYDKALQGFIILQSVQDIARLQIKKNLWRLVVKLLLNKSLLIAEEDYSSFASLEESFEKSFIEEVIQQEILSIKYTLLTGYVKESNFLKWRANYFLKVLAPLSKRLNLSIQLEEVEQLALKVLYPVQFKEITDFLDNLFCDKENFAINVKLELEKRLKESEIQAEVTYRIKTPYSIYRKKTERKRATLEKILDFVGFRIITENVDDCYRVLTVVENMGSRFEGRGILAEALRDYIKSPKLETGYQSIHINIEIPANVDIYGEPNSHVVEFQIRTQAMHAVANRGESSHSYYKDALRYSRPTLTKDFKVSQKSFRLLVECEKSLISEVGKTIRSMHFDILSVDIEGTTNGRILLRLELRIRKQKDSLSQESSTVSSLVLALESLTFTQNEEN